MEILDRRPTQDSSGIGIWEGSPCFYSFSLYYFLAILLIVLHFLAAEYFLDFSLVFLACVLIPIGGLTVVISNHSKYFGIQIILNGLIPLSLELYAKHALLENASFVIGGYNELIILGIISASFFTIMVDTFRRSFVYKISRSSIHFEYNFFNIARQTTIISLSHVESVTLVQNLLANIFGFGHIILVTGSGFSLQDEEVGAALVVGQKKQNLLFQILIFVGLMLTFKRRRKAFKLHPLTCLYGIRDPSDAFPRIRQNMDYDVGAVSRNE